MISNRKFSNFSGQVSVFFCKQNSITKYWKCSIFRDSSLYESVVAEEKIHSISSREFCYTADSLPILGLAYSKQTENLQILASKNLCKNGLLDCVSGIPSLFTNNLDLGLLFKKFRFFVVWPFMHDDFFLHICRIILVTVSRPTLDIGLP